MVPVCGYAALPAAGLGQVPKFETYGPSHLAVLALLVVLALFLIRLGRRLDVEAAQRFSRAFAIVILAFGVSLQVYSMLPVHWDLGRSLPFHLCDLAWVVSVVALWTHRHWAYSLLYFWGLTLTLQALLTPQLERDFPHLEFVMFWGLHGLIVVAALFMTWGLGFRPDWSSYRRAVVVTIGWAGLMLPFNAAAGTNYLYVNDKPPDPSILDLLGEWPWYLLGEIALLLLVWAAITAPWTRRSTSGGASRSRARPARW